MPDWTTTTTTWTNGAVYQQANLQQLAAMGNRSAAAKLATPVDYRSQTEFDTWENEQHEKKKIVDLETSHLENIIKGLEAGKGYYNQVHKLPFLKAELNSRQGTK